MRRYFVYIVANKNRTIYVGMTNNLMRRIQEHKEGQIAGFTAKYKTSTLVFFEEFGDVRDAIAREKQLKGYDRLSKIALIEGKNPQWDDLAADWF